MPHPLRLAALVLLPMVLAAGALAARPNDAAASSAASPAGLCRPAIAAAERTHGIPHALLLAIGRVESGRRDPETGEFGPWPWTINAEGTGQYFPTKEAAIAAVRALQARGVRSIDVGCMQVNLHHHPHAFASLEEAFDPVRNADYAARFLVDLQARTNSWTQAAAHYHSHTPELAEAYKRRVLAAWPEETRHAAQAHRQAQAAIWASWRAGGGGRIVHLAAPAVRPAPPDGAPTANSRGRDLDSYRAAPIPAARPIALLAQLSALRSGPNRTSR